MMFCTVLVRLFMNAVFQFSIDVCHNGHILLTPHVKAAY